MRNTNAVTETMNIQLRQTKFRYWRRSNVRSAGSASILLGILYPMFIDWDPLSVSMLETAALPVDISLHAVHVAHVQEAPLVFFQNKASQAAGRIRGSVNSDSIGTNLWGDRRRVTVHDKFSVFRLTGQERVSDIEKIIAILAIEGHARPYSSVAEKVITNIR